MLRYTYDPPYNQWYGVKNKNLLRFKVTYGGTVATASDLPPRGFMPGVMFNVQEDGSNYMWNGLTWDKMDSNPFVGATSSKDGIQGLVPEPKVANREGFLYGGGGWKNLDASDVKTGVFALARIPAAAMERLVTVNNQTARYALTKSDIQIGDTVKQVDTGIMYRVVDDDNLDNASGYVEYTTAKASYANETNGIAVWDAAVDYAANRIVLGSDGLLYFSVAQSGPNVGGVQDPVADISHTYWASSSIPTMPANDSSKSAANTEWINTWYSRKVLPSNVYVDPVNGNNSNDGFSAAKAKKTIAAAESIFLSKTSIPPATVYINLADGDYGTGAIVGVSGVDCYYRGPSASGQTARVARIEPGIGRYVILGGNINTGYVRSARNAILRIESALNLTIDTSVYGSNTLTHAFYVYSGGVFTSFANSSATISFLGNWTFSTAVIDVENNGSLAFYGNITWNVPSESSVTGKRYRIVNGSGADGIGGANVIPGTVAGTVDSTSYFS